MYSYDFNGQPVFVVSEAPDWRSAPEVEFSLVRDRQSGLTTREARRPFSRSLLCKVAYQVIVRDDAMRRLQGKLREMKDDDVVLPFFPVARRWADRASEPIQGGLNIVWKSDWSQFDIYEAGDEPGWPLAADNWAPALFGYINKTPLEMLSPIVASFTLDFVEAGPAEYALQPTAAVFTDGPTPAGYPAAPKLLPAFPSFTRITEELTAQMDRTQIGFIREQPSTFYEHAVFRTQESEYLLVDAQPARMLRFFSDLAGPGSLFWACSWLTAARFTQDVLAADTVLNVSSTAVIVEGDYLALFTRTITAVKVLSKTDTTITLTAPVGANFQARSTCIFPLHLARLDEPRIRFAWDAPRLVRCSIPWTERPAEITVAADEELGETIGRLPLRVVLFEFQRDMRNGTTVTSRFTNFESDIDDGANLWTHSSFAHGDIRQSLNLEDDTTSLTSFIFANNPLLVDLALRSEATLTVVIRWADWDGEALTNVGVMFTGTVTEPSREGSNISAKMVSGVGQIDSPFPHFVHGIMCSNLTGTNIDGSFLISAGCALLRANWKFTAVVDAPLASGYPFELNLKDLARDVGDAPTYFPDWFAFGIIEWGAAAAVQRRFVTKSTIPVAGVFSVKIQKWFDGDGPQLDDVVTIYPGCDGTKETCQAYHATDNPTGKFDNYLNFGGDPFTPVGNPSTLKLNTATTQGGKK